MLTKSKHLQAEYKDNERSRNIQRVWAKEIGEVYDGEENMKANMIDASKYLKVEEGLKVVHF